jgi:hypothetical protein
LTETHDESANGGGLKLPLSDGFMSRDTSAATLQRPLDVLRLEELA